MPFPELYVSKPGLELPQQRVDNAGVIARVKERYRGDEKEWHAIERTIERVFSICKSQHRYMEDDPKARVAGYAARAARDCLAQTKTDADEIDLVIFGGIARQYFEPATGMEVAAQLGLSGVHVFDVTSACVGHLEAIQTACAYLNLHPHYRTALVCTAELTGPFLSYDIQSTEDLQTKATGLTIGHAASCVLVRREPWSQGCLRIAQVDTYSLPEHWALCQVPIDGTLSSSSTELMRLSRHIEPRLAESLARIGWDPKAVDHYVFHQPSESMVTQVLRGVGADPQAAIYTHHLYGNTSSATVGVAYHELLAQRELAAGDKLVLGSAAAGFSMVVIAGEWHSATSGGSPG